MALSPRFSTGFRDQLLEGQTLQSMFDGANSGMQIFSGAQAADADAADPSGELANVVIPTTNAFAAATTGTGAAFKMPKAGAWADASIATGGTALSFRLTEDTTSNGASTTLVRMDGSVGVGTFDLPVSTDVLVTAEPLTIDTFAITIPFT